MESQYVKFEEDSFSEPSNRFDTDTVIKNPILDQDGKLVRLRAVESENEYYLKTMNLTTLRWLAWIQAGASLTIFISQIAMYCTVGRSNNFKPVDWSGVGIFGPLMFFIVASGLTWMATKYPSGCNIGAAMGFQIASVIFGGLLALLAVISLIMHGRYNYFDDNYDPEVAGRVFCSFIILSSALIIVTSVLASLHFCRTVCCGRQRFVESVMFDVVTNK